MDPSLVDCVLFPASNSNPPQLNLSVYLRYYSVMKIIDKISKPRDDGKPYYSFEYFPPKTEVVSDSLFSEKYQFHHINSRFMLSFRV